MLTLITFKPCLGTRSPSPFAVKAEALMVFSELPFEVEYGDVRKAPRGKFPVLKDGETLIPDTAHIQTHLEIAHGVDFDGWLDGEQKAASTAFKRLIEHHFYFINAYFRWTDHPEGVRDSYFEDVPKLMRGLVFNMVRKNLMKTMHLQGISRHSRREIEAFGKEDVDALANHLGDKPYFMGDRFSSVDASLFGALEGLIPCTLETPVGEMVKQHDNLVAYHARLTQELFE